MVRPGGLTPGLCQEHLPWRRPDMGEPRTCPCGNQAANKKGPPRCEPCRRERVRLTQQRHRDKSRGSHQRGWDEPACIWCTAEIANQRSYLVLQPKKFCSEDCRHEFWAEQRRFRSKTQRRCECGAEPVNKTGIPNCAECRTRKKQQRVREHTLRVYGINGREYDRLLDLQGGRCAICRTRKPGRGKPIFAVDHDHVTGQVRGLLCYKCNTAVAYLQDDPKVLRAAVRYVEQHRQMELFSGKAE
jgi:hypothetical protein